MLTVLEAIQLAGSLLGTIANASEAFNKIKTNLERNTEMTEEERKAFEDLKASDHAKPYWQSDVS